MANGRVRLVYEIAMASIQDEILKKFLSRISETDGFSEGQVEQIRDLFEGKKRPKATDLIKVFSVNSTEVLP